MSSRSKITVVRREANFDRACDEAYSMALECVRDNQRPADFDVNVKFISYQHIGTHVGHEYRYTFETWLRKV